MKTIFYFFLTILASPFLLIATAFRKKNTTRKVLVITLGKLGDTVCVTPLFRAIKESDPSAIVHVLCLRSSASVLKGNPFITEIHTLDDQTDRWNVMHALKKERFDTVINALPNAYGSMVGPWVLAKTNVNSFSDIHGIMVHILMLFQTNNTKYGIGMNTFAHYMTLAEKAGFKRIPHKLDYFYSDAAKTKAHELITANHLTGKPFVVLNVTAGNKVKEWPEEKFIALARHITDNKNMHVVISTADKQAAESIIANIERGPLVVNGSGISLEETGALYAEAKAFVGVDTGPMYIAYAVGCPVVIIMGPIDPNEQIPPAGKHVEHVPPPPGTIPWMFVARSPRTATQAQLAAARDTSLESVIQAVDRILL